METAITSSVRAPNQTALMTAAGVSAISTSSMMRVIDISEWR